MPRAYDPAKLVGSLFGKRPSWRGQPTPYKTWKSELAAIAARKKGAALFWWSAEYFATREFRELVADVHEHDLTLVLDADSQPGVFRVLVVHASETWRVPALRAFEQMPRGLAVTEGVEAIRSALIGYSPAQVRDWIAWCRQRDAGPGVTVYAVIDRARERAIRRLGRRSLGDPDAIAGTRLFVDDARALKPRAHALVPRDLRLARFALEGQWVSEVFGRRPQLLVTPAIAERLNDFVRSQIQFLGARGWL